MTHRMVLALIVGSVACSSAPDELDSVAQVARTSSALTGYQHFEERSRFSSGKVVLQVTEFGIHKRVGEWGVFGTRVKTGLVLALPNGNAPTMGKGPLAGGAKAHDSFVEEYFVAGGLPLAQVAGVRAMSEMAKVGEVTPESDGFADAKLVGFYSVIDRHAGGVPVRDSFAWAQVNEDSEVVTESIYWPPLPGSVVARAKELETMLADPELRQAYFQKVPSHGKVVIRHTSGVWDGAFTACASYDVEWAGRVLHYDLQGNRFSLPDEESAAP